MEQNVGVTGAAEVVEDDLHEIEAARALLAIAFEEGTIDEEDLLLFTFALDEDERKGRVVEADIPGARFRLDAQSDASCLSMFRFTKAEIRRMCRLLQLPGTTTARNRTTWTAEEGLCIVLRRLAYPCRLADLLPIFGRWKPELSIIINTVCKQICDKWSGLVTDFTKAHFLTEERLQSYAAAVSARSPLTNCFGFIDGTVRAICRPTVGQKSFYNGHKRHHGLKFQTVVTPDGIIAHMYGPLEGCRHDSAMLRESGLFAQLNSLPAPPEGGVYCIYGDPAYPLRPQLLCPYKGDQLTDAQAAFNKEMSAVRIAVEWAYGKTIQLFAFLDFKKNLKLLLQPVGMYYYTGVLLTNCHTCLHGGEINKLFDLQPPSLEEYLS